MADTKPDTAADGPEKVDSNSVQVSLKFPVFRYVSAVKRLLREGNETAELSGIGNAVTPVVSAIEILKKQDMVVVVSIKTELASVPTHSNTEAQVPRLAISVKKSANFDKLDAEQQEEAAKRRAEREAAKEAAGAEEKKE
eukprot:NODE_2683_length_520_cov_237.035623_g2633_i0.p2 GENE.NODE_2683_length_520_cov_237.035623_g2633_i0~~NODE_2683_length_520_cov_237.035623_g2633_i0.p2  ORF type:complete len:140 (+),score=53.42 NODE_2683_length_520_cov_237.035623_g2633_i0:86-505(+)